MALATAEDMEFQTLGSRYGSSSYFLSALSILYGEGRQNYRELIFTGGRAQADFLINTGLMRLEHGMLVRNENLE